MPSRGKCSSFARYRLILSEEMKYFCLIHPDEDVIISLGSLDFPDIAGLAIGAGESLTFDGPVDPVYCAVTVTARAAYLKIESRRILTFGDTSSSSIAVEPRLQSELFELKVEKDPVSRLTFEDFVASVSEFMHINN